MRFKEFFYDLLQEGANQKIIVVDVQPEYAKFSRENNRISEKIINFVKNQNFKTLMFVNAEDTGVSADSIDDIKYFWEENGFEDWHNVTIVDKGYGYLRSWMDLGVSDKSIIKAIRMMYQMKISDSRGVVEDYDDEASAEKWKELLEDPNIPQDSISVQWTSVKRLREYNGAYIVGGGRDECLREVTLLMNAFNIKYTLIDSLIY